MKCSWAEQFLTNKQVADVSAAVHRVEATTSGEIVPMIVRRSSAIGHVKVILGLLLLLLIAAIDVAGTHFTTELTLWFYEKLGIDFLKVLVWFTAIAALLTFPVAIFLSRFAWMQRALTSDDDMAFEVMERAQLEFYWSNLVKTEKRTGILIFLSLMEHRCVVLADQGISKLLPKETWDDIVKTVISGIKNGRSSEGLIEAIEKCGKILAQHFPPTSANPNELSNSLIVKE